MSEKRRLIFSIVQFLNKELGSEDISDDAKESLEVASQCLQTAYCLAPEDTHLEVSSGLEDIFTTATKNEPVSFSCNRFLVLPNHVVANFHFATLFKSLRLCCFRQILSNL